MSPLTLKKAGDRVRPTPHPDRIGLPSWLVISLAVASALGAGLVGALMAHRRFPPAVGFGAGSLVTLAAVVGLRSVSIRLVARVSLLVSAVLLVRFGLLAGSLVSGGQLLLAWLVAAAAVLVLSDRVGTEAAAALGPTDAAGSRGPVAPASATAAAPGPTARTTLVVAAVVVVLVVLATPWVLPHVGKPTQAGRGAEAEQSGATSSLRASNQLDMTTRPDLTDEVMFTVEADRATFWRGETFDVWDGRTWTRRDGTVSSVPPGTQVRHSADDVGAGGSDVVRQRIRIETGYSDIVYAAASADRVEVDRPVGQRDDGTLVAAPLGQGTTYTAMSRRVPVTEAALRAANGSGAGAVPASIMDRYAQPPRTSARVLAAARRATGGAATTYDRVLALEDWMGKRTTYSLDAPLAPKGVDVVDDFLFESRQGWCEQIASSLVVLARAEGIPARLVTGFVPGERDRLSGTFTVRARDAHAWAEVWFPRVGWVPFDPTADVPLAGADKPQQTLGGWLVDHAVVLLLGLTVLVLIVGPLRSLVRRTFRRRQAARRPVEWAAAADAALDALGARLDRPRLPGESASAYARVLADGYHDDRLLAVGLAVDDSLFAPDGPTDDVRSAVDATLAELGDQPVPTTAGSSQESPRQPEPAAP